MSGKGANLNFILFFALIVLATTFMLTSSLDEYRRNNNSNINATDPVKKWKIIHDERVLLMAESKERGISYDSLMLEKCRCDKIDPQNQDNILYPPYTSQTPNEELSVQEAEILEKWKIKQCRKICYPDEPKEE